MSNATQRVNIMEMVGALAGIHNTKNESVLSDELRALIAHSLHPTDLPTTLNPSAAEAFQLAFEAWGGLPRLLLFADRYPGAFLKLYARQTQQTIAPVLPRVDAPDVVDEWPAWMTPQRLAYQQTTTPPDDVDGD